jgi:hypothetical protein
MEYLEGSFSVFLEWKNFWKIPHGKQKIEKLKMKKIIIFEFLCPE